MLPCTGCSRFIQSDAHRCPFCDTIQRATPSPLRPAVTSVILGLTLSACGTPSTGDEGASASEAMTGPTTAATMDGSGATSVSSMSGATMSTSTVSTSTMSSVGDTEGEAAVTAYGGPDVDTSPPEETIGSTIGDGTTSTGTGTGTGTGTASSSGQ